MILWVEEDTQCPEAWGWRWKGVQIRPRQPRSTGCIVHTTFRENHSHTSLLKKNGRVTLHNQTKGCTDTHHYVYHATLKETFGETFYTPLKKPINYEYFVEKFFLKSGVN